MRFSVRTCVILGAIATTVGTGATGGAQAAAVTTHASIGPTVHPQLAWAPVGRQPLSDAKAAALVTIEPEIRPNNIGANNYVPVELRAAEIPGDQGQLPPDSGAAESLVRTRYRSVSSQEPDHGYADSVGGSQMGYSREHAAGARVIRGSMAHGLGRRPRPGSREVVRGLSRPRLAPVTARCGCRWGSPRFKVEAGRVGECGYTAPPLALNRIQSRLRRCDYSLLLRRQVQLVRPRISRRRAVGQRRRLESTSSVGQRARRGGTSQRSRSAHGARLDSTGMVNRKLRTALVTLLALLAFPAVAAAKTTVSIEFDDGDADQSAGRDDAAKSRHGRNVLHRLGAYRGERQHDAALK